MRLSLLPTGPPPVFQHWCVRPSTARYGRFSLPMGRSPGFASIAPDYCRPVRTRFRFGSPPEGVNRAGHDNSPDHYAKGTRSGGPEGHRPPTARRHGVSGSVSSPDRGSSHRSVALLGSLSVVIAYLALRAGPRRLRPVGAPRCGSAGASPPIRAGFHVPDPTRVPLGRVDGATDGALTRCGATFQWTSASTDLGNSHVNGPPTPPRAPPPPCRPSPVAFASPRPWYPPWERPHAPAGCPRRFRLFPVRSPLL